jgi:polysaccharide biosynthesis/export protein
MSQVWRLIKLTALVGLLAGIVGCSGDLSKSAQTKPSSGAASYGMASPSSMASALGANISDDDYRITSQDVLSVSIFQVPDLNRTVVVDGRGFVSLPLVGQVPVRGKTILQAQEQIAAGYGRSYLQSPQVTVSLVKSSQRVTVSGAVRSPTVLSLEGTLTLSQAIAQSGGMGETGNPQRIHIARSTGQQVEDQVYDLDEIQAGKVPNPELRGGDIVVVEDANTKLALKTFKDLLPLAIVGSFISDMRLKRDISPVARENGLQLYRYRYAWSDTLYVGVLAQEVLEVAPNAVVQGADGYFRVDYGRLGLRLQRWQDWIALHPTGQNLAEVHEPRSLTKALSGSASKH